MFSKFSLFLGKLHGCFQKYNSIQVWIIYYRNPKHGTCAVFSLWTKHRVTLAIHNCRCIFMSLNQGCVLIISRITRMIQILLTTMKTEKEKSISERTSTELQQGSSCRKRTGREFQSTHSPAVADCWVVTGPESSSAKSKKATHGAVCASRIITWDQKTLAKSTQRCSSEEARNASDQNAMWRCDLWSGKKEESTWRWRIWGIFAITVSRAVVTS